jgi:hypothetical protein
MRQIVGLCLVCGFDLGHQILTIHGHEILKSRTLPLIS